MMAEQVGADRVGAEARQQLADHDQVLERLAHLLAANSQHAHVHPGADKRFASGEALYLGDLRLMVRENQVAAATVNVDGNAEQAMRHRSAFDVPAGPPFTPWAGPV